MLFNCVVIIAKKQTAYCNPFRPVETRLNLSKHVSIRSDLSRPVSRLPPLPRPPPPTPSPFSTFFFLGGGGWGREGEGEGGENTTTTKNPPDGGRGGTKSPPLPHRILTTKSNQNSQNLCNLLQNLCNLPTYTLEVSLSPQLLLKTT